MASKTTREFSEVEQKHLIENADADPTVLAAQVGATAQQVKGFLRRHKRDVENAAKAAAKEEVKKAARKSRTMEAMVKKSSITGHSVTIMTDAASEAGDKQLEKMSRKPVFDPSYMQKIREE
jgi:hypothetical protein